MSAGLAAGGARGKCPRRSAILWSDQISHRSGRPSGTARWRTRSACPRTTTVRGSSRVGSPVARCQRIKKSRQDFRLYGLQMPERITIFRFQAASGGTFQDIVHDRRALCGNVAAAVRHKEVTFSPQSADRQPGQYALVPLARLRERTSWLRAPEPEGNSEPKRGPIGSTNSPPAVRVG